MTPYSVTADGIPATRAPLSRLAVDRAVSELRRARPVVIGPSAGTGLLVAAAEGIHDKMLHLLAETGASDITLAITGKRAEVIGLTGREEKIVTLKPPRAMDSEWVAGITNPVTGKDNKVRSWDRELIDLQTRPPFDSFSAAVVLAKHARLLPAVVGAEIVESGAGDLYAWALRHDFLIVDAGDIFQYQTTTAHSLTLVSQARVPLGEAQETVVKAFRPIDGGLEHLAIIIGEPDLEKPVLVRVHSECFTGDLLGSLRCDCGDQLKGAIREISANGSGVLLYLAQEGRGIGLVNKLRAYQLQDDGFDTIDANEQLGFDADERIYLPAATMLGLMGFNRVRLLTNNPLKVDALNRCGVDVTERVPHQFPANKHNEVYLKTKATRSGHYI